MNETRRSFYPAIGLSEQVLSTGQHYADFKQTKSWEQYAQAFEVALKILQTEPPALVGLAETPAKVEKLIREHAVAISEHRCLMDSAEAAAQYAHNSVDLEARQAAAELIDMTQTAFADALEQFKATLNAPEELHGYESDEQVAEYQAHRRAANDMQNQVGARLMLGKALLDGGMQAEAGLWAFVESPGDKASPDHLQFMHNLVQTAGDVMAMPPVARYRFLLEHNVALSIPRLNTVTTRRDEWEKARTNALSQAQLTPLGEQQRREALGLPESPMAQVAG